MKIVLKLVKEGQVLAQSEVDVDSPENLTKEAGRAFKRFRKEHPDVQLFGDGVYLRFDKAE